jgi:hypothetical protein
MNFKFQFHFYEGRQDKSEQRMIQTIRDATYVGNVICTFLILHVCTLLDFNFYVGMYVRSYFNKID